jgi:hypothetical protein
MAGLNEPVRRQRSRDVAHHAVSDREPHAAKEAEQPAQATDRRPDRLRADKVPECDPQGCEWKQADEQQRRHLKPLARREADAERESGAVKDRDRHRGRQVGDEQLRAEVDARAQRCQAQLPRPPHGALDRDPPACPDRRVHRSE